MLASTFIRFISMQESTRVPAAAVHPAEDGATLARAEAAEADARLQELRAVLMTHIVGLAAAVVRDHLSGAR